MSMPVFLWCWGIQLSQLFYAFNLSYILCRSYSSNEFLFRKLIGNIVPLSIVNIYDFDIFNFTNIANGHIKWNNEIRNILEIMINWWFWWAHETFWKWKLIHNFWVFIILMSILIILDKNESWLNVWSQQTTIKIISTK